MHNIYTIRAPFTCFSGPNFNITTLSEHVGSDGVTVTLGVIGENGHLITYNISVVPQVPINNTERGVYQLYEMNVPYNTLLNVSVSASLCGGSIANRYIELYYG